MNKLIEDSLKVLEDAEKDRDKEHRKKMEDMSIKFFGEEYLRNWLKYEQNCLRIIGTRFFLKMDDVFDDSFYLVSDSKTRWSEFSDLEIKGLESLGRAIKDEQRLEEIKKDRWWKRFLG